MRLADALLLLWIVTTLTFVMLHLAPGDPATLLIGPTATAEEIARQRATLGLDRSLPEQYVRWIGALLRGDLGTSLAHGRPVTALVGEALPLSLFLGGTSLLASVLIGALLGWYQALRAGTRADTTVTVLTTTLYAAPSFWLALALLAAATSGAASLGAPAWLRLPAFGVREPAALATGWGAFTDLARHAVLPLLVLTIPGAAGIARYARSSFRDAASAPHVPAAEARGLSRLQLERRYVLRNAWTPIVVLVGLSLPGIIAGSVFVEQVFAWPGLGRTMLSAIAARDYPVVLALTLVYAAAVIAANALADTVVSKLDPRRGAANAAGAR